MILLKLGSELQNWAKKSIRSENINKMRTEFPRNGMQTTTQKKLISKSPALIGLRKLPTTEIIWTLLHLKEPYQENTFSK